MYSSIFILSIKASSAAISWFHTMLGYKPTFKDDPVYQSFTNQVHKIYKPVKDKRIPISLHHEIEFAKYYGVNINTAWHVSFSRLLPVLLSQIYSSCGCRGSELLSSAQEIKNGAIQVKHYSNLLWKKPTKILKIKSIFQLLYIIFGKS